MKTLKRACYKIQSQVRKTFADNRNIKVNWIVVYINCGIIKAEINMVDIIHKRYKWALKISKNKCIYIKVNLKISKIFVD